GGRRAGLPSLPGEAHRLLRAGAGAGRSYYAGLLEALTMIMGCAQGYLRDHGPRVAVLASRLGRELDLSEDACARLFFAGVLSDMGMVGLAEDAWEHPRPTLSPEARARVRLHPERSQEAVRRIPYLESLAPLIRSHHEWWNGSGYPDGLVGERIPEEARILRLADTVSALRQPRPHRRALTADEASEIVRRSGGQEFGPGVTRVFLSMDRGGRVPGYDPQVYRTMLGGFAGTLLPEAVPPLSAQQLLRILADLIDAKDPYTAGHSRRVAALAVAVAEQLGLPGAV